MPFKTINLHESGLQFAYTDSGAPTQDATPYITIIAVHGLCFTAPIFRKIQTLAPQKGVRVVAVNRRGYPETTALDENETKTVVDGSKEQKDTWIVNRGLELSLFIDRFIEEAGDVPPISNDGRTGGVALLSWSLGTCYASAAVAHADRLPTSVQSRLSSYIRAVVFHEPHSGHFGFPPLEGEYVPLMDPYIPAEHRYAAFEHWVSGYFEHADDFRSAKDPKRLSWVIPSTIRPGSLYNMTKDEQAEVICNGEDHEGPSVDLAFMLNFPEQLRTAYRKVFYDDPTARVFPKVKISHVAGEMTPAFGIVAFWNVEKDVRETGKDINMVLVPGVNHFLHWDDPEKALEVFLACA